MEPNKFIKRMRSNISEEDLLAEQKKFLEQKNDPNFRLNVDKIYKSQKQEEVIQERQEHNLNEDKIDMQTNVVMPLQIIEREVNLSDVQSFFQATNVPVTKIDSTLLQESFSEQTSGKARVSLFARQHMSKKQINHPEKSYSSSLKSSIINGSGLCSDIEAAEKAAKCIDKENEELLSKLTDSQKQQAINELGLRNINPDLLVFLKNRKQKGAPGPEVIGDPICKDASLEKVKEKSLTAQQINKEKKTLLKSILKSNSQESNEKKSVKTISFDSSADKSTSYLPISEKDIEIGNWFNMNSIEHEKLEWLKPLDEPRADKCSEESLTARFKFNGDLAMEEKLNLQDGLHHHGEEQIRAGYTINELLTLCQSKFPAQKVIALQTLGNIFERLHRGYFDVCFDKPFSSTLYGDSDVLIIIRTCLDDNHESVIPAAIKCLHGLVCNTLYDEASLDRLFCSTELGIEIPSLDPNPSLVESDLKDSALCRVDVIRGLLRIDTLARLRYLLDFSLKQKLDRVIIENILDIFIRITRHSAYACDQLIKTPYLLDSLIDNFIPSHTSNTLNWKALKVLRILFTTKFDYANLIMKNYPRLWSIFNAYLLLDPFAGSYEKDSQQAKQVYAITIEILRLWRILLISKQFPDVCERFLEIAAHMRNCSKIDILARNAFDLHFVANTFLCLVHVIKQMPELNDSFTPIIRDLVFEWCSKLHSYEMLPELDSILALASGLHYLAGSSLPNEQLYKHAFIPIMKSNLWPKIGQNLIKYSSVIHYQEIRNHNYRDSNALPSFGSIRFGGTSVQLNFTLQEECALPLITPLLNIARRTSPEVLQDFLLSKELVDYAKRTCSSPCSFNWNIFELMEMNTLAQVALCAYSLPSSHLHVELAMKIINSVGDLQLRGALFDYVFEVKNFENCFQEEMLEEMNREQNTAAKCLANIKQTYGSLASFESYFWLFEPILSLLQSQNDPTKKCVLNEQQVTQHVNNNLLMIYLVAKTHSAHFDHIGLNKELFLIFVSLVFRLNNGIFLDSHVHMLLDHLLRIIGTNLIVKDAETKLPEPLINALTNFEQLLTSFQEESYGDALFSSYLLLYLQPSSNRAFRKRAFNDHSGSLKCFILTIEQCALPLEQLLKPSETDATIIESQFRCLISREVDKNKNPLLYQIFLNHVATFLYEPEMQNFRDLAPNLTQTLLNSIERTSLDTLKSDLFNFRTNKMIL